jgi:SAM-dependent methyltransferase
LDYVSQDFGQYDGVGDDAALQMGEFDYGRLDIVGDIASIDQPDSSFDAVMCVEVLEHLPDPIQAIREFSRLLKQDGHLIVCGVVAAILAGMSISDWNRAWARRVALAVLPTRAADRVRELVRSRFYRSVSMVSREPGWVVWSRRVVLRRKPVLYHFEVHITDHCNLNCRGCAHFSNLCEPKFADLAEFEADMHRMASLFSAVRQIYVLGGEPLLHPGVASFVRSARAAFPDTRICLMTNGTLVTRMSEVFWASLAETRVILLCDSYPIGLPVEEIDRLGREHGVKVEWTVPREQFFRIPIDIAGGHDPASSFARCQGFNNCPIIRDGRLYPCAYAAYADVFKERFGIDGLTVSPADSVSIREGADPEVVAEFLRRPIPWCANCDMDRREFLEWGRSKREIGEWTVQDTQARS